MYQLLIEFLKFVPPCIRKKKELLESRIQIQIHKKYICIFYYTFKLNCGPEKPFHLPCLRPIISLRLSHKNSSRGAFLWRPDDEKIGRFGILPVPCRYALLNGDVKAVGGPAILFALNRLRLPVLAGNFPAGSPAPGRIKKDFSEKKGHG